MNLLKHFSTIPNKPLYHYTSLKGFLGIINDGEIWATSIFYLNDQSELNRAITLLKTELNSRIEKLREEHNNLGTEINSTMIKVEAKVRFFENVRDTASAIIENNDIQFYVCSFTELDDNLSQWRAYSQDGKGISIGFDFSNFEPNGSVRKCIYNEKKQEQILKDLVNYWHKQLDPNLEGNIDETKTDSSNFSSGAGISSYFVERCLSSFFEVAPFFKHPKYEEEAEWRKVIGGAEEICTKIKFMDYANLLKPYCCLKLAHLPQINQLRVGSSSHISLNKSSIRLLLKSKGISEDLVTESEIPYRGKI